jgi:mannose-6-phosphate isomerase
MDGAMALHVQKEARNFAARAQLTKSFVRGTEKQLRAIELPPYDCKRSTRSYLGQPMQETAASTFSQPLVFEPLFLERMWGGRRLESHFGKKLPTGTPIGESWEVVDRAEAQSIVRDGPWRGHPLHDLWINHRREVFGEITEAPRFPLLIKLLDAQEKLSVQVHPPPRAATELGGEAKTEFWYVAHADPAAEVYVGLKERSSRAELEEALATGTLAEHVQRLPVHTGDAMFLPSGRVHAVGAGSVLVEVQQNSDTTYRLFDWNRLGTDGAPRKLHIEESLRSIDFEDCAPELIRPTGESLLQHFLFAVEKWELRAPREVAPRGTFAIVSCLTGAIRCAGVSLQRGEFFLVPASLPDRDLQPTAPETTLLRITIPG